MAADALRLRAAAGGGAIMACAQAPDVAAVRAIVAGELAARVSARRAARVAPAVVALRAKAATVVETELARLGGKLGELDDQARAEIAQAMHRVAGKLLHPPTVRVKELAGSPDGDSYETALRMLFDLEPGAVDTVTTAKPGPVPHACFPGGLARRGSSAPSTGPSAHPPGLRHSRSAVAAGRAFAVLGGQVFVAAVGAQPVQRHHVHSDDGQCPERVGRDEEHHVDGVEPDHGHREPAGQLVARQDPGRGDQLQDGEDQRDPPPSALVGGTATTCSPGLPPSCAPDARCHQWRHIRLS
jgi:hypothetical protein